MAEEGEQLPEIPDGVLAVAFGDGRLSSTTADQIAAAISVGRTVTVAFSDRDQMRREVLRIFPLNRKVICTVEGDKLVIRSKYPVRKGRPEVSEEDDY